ncbi:MAG: glycosyltransferase, partial [Thermoplasmata archaeon]
MKIVFISTLYPPKVMGGAEIVVEKITKELTKKGHKIAIITLNRKKPKLEARNNIKIYRIPLNLYFLPDFHHQNIVKRIAWQLIDLVNIKSYLKVRKILEKETPDLVHIHNYKGLS